MTRTLKGRRETTGEGVHALAAVVIARRQQMRARLVLCFANALVFHALSGAAAAALWAAAYICLQIVEAIAFRDIEAQTRFSARRRVVFLAMLALSNVVFASFGILEALHYSVWGLLGAGLLWSGALLNGAMLSGQSRQALAASLGPPVLAFFTAPFFVLANGGTLWLGLAMTAAGVQNGIAAVAVWAASRRLIEATARANETARLALIDAETGLPNRYELERRVAALRTETAGGVVVVAAIGVDRFDNLYSAIGHAPTVALVGAVAARLAAAAPGVEITRLSTNMLGAAWVARDPEDAHRAMMKLYYAMEAPIALAGAPMEAPIALAGAPIDVSVTIGLGEGDASDEATATATAIIDRAIIAIEQGRRSRQPVACFDRDLRGDPAADLSLMSDMLGALDRDAMGLHYQPKLDLRTNAIVGVEALVRWSHPQRGGLAPDAFLPLAEETGRIAALTRWVLKQAIADQKRLLAFGYPLSFAVNLSGRLLDDPYFALAIQAIACEAAGEIILEVTETAIIGNPQVARQTLEAFRAAGIGISIDDYGSGLSSLGYLKNIPADELKVDKMFVLNLAEDRTDAMLVRSAIDLAHSLGLRVVGEGVETQGALAMLAAMGCDLAQGYLVARPMPFADLEKLLRRRDSDGAPPRLAKSRA